MKPGRRWWLQRQTPGAQSAGQADGSSAGRQRARPSGAPACPSLCQPAPVWRPPSTHRAGEEEVFQRRHATYEHACRGAHGGLRGMAGGVGGGRSVANGGLGRGAAPAAALVIHPAARTMCSTSLRMKCHTTRHHRGRAGGCASGAGACCCSAPPSAPELHLLLLLLLPSPSVSGAVCDTTTSAGSGAALAAAAAPAHTASGCPAPAGGASGGACPSMASSSRSLRGLVGTRVCGSD